MKFDFATANRIIFGCGTLEQLGDICREWGRRGLLITTAHSAKARFVHENLQAKGFEIALFIVDHEPTINLIENCLARMRDQKIEFVISMGGGSAIDTGKAVAALLANPGNLLDYLEVVGLSKPLQNSSLPFVAMPTTAGTGSEVTRNAVIGVPERQVKVSMRGAYLLPKVALIDPELTLELPAAVTASTGMDALTQLIEAFVTRKANWLVDSLCRDGVLKIARSLGIAYRQNGDIAAREDMSYASLLSGIALANAGLGAVHGFAGPIGGMFNAPHGAICARLLPIVFEFNARMAQTTNGGSFSAQKFDALAQWLTGSSRATFRDGVKWLHGLCGELDIHPLRHYGLAPEHIDVIVSKAAEASSMKGNPVALSQQALADILAQAI